MTVSSTRESSRFVAGRGFIILALVLIIPVMFLAVPGFAEADEDYEPIDSSMCGDCHEASEHESSFEDDLSHSVHEGLECLDCHQNKDTIPHKELAEPFYVGCEGCRTCHEEASEEYQAHGRAEIGTCEDMPHCSDCHGSHDILPSTAARSRVHPSNLRQTCGACHENLDITTKYETLYNNPVAMYEASVHGKVGTGGAYSAAGCVDCHGVAGSAHKILAPIYPESAISHRNIPVTCGQCHKAIEQDYWDGIHGKLVKDGNTRSPVCTDCHGEHGILSAGDPNSPVSKAEVAQETCARCHNAMVLNEKYGRTASQKVSFIDSYHGLKSGEGDSKVANCASCHGAHRILPSSDPGSSVNTANLRQTCGECHPKITDTIAQSPIHGVGEVQRRAPIAQWVQKIYIILIILVIGGMFLHNALDYITRVREMLARRPRVRRMRMDEVWQHTLLMVSFIVLVISGFSLTYHQSFIAKFFFGWDGGFAMRGTVHRIAAVVMTIGSFWHLFYCFTARGRKFVKDMLPTIADVHFFINKMLGFIGKGHSVGCTQRFNYAEKAEYWALIWGTIVMAATGMLLWFKNFFSAYVGREFFDVAVTIHFWEAWLASLAILIWHMYGVMFNPEVYPMNPSWINGTMSEELYKHEHPGHLEEARAETDDLLRKHLSKVRRDLGDDDDHSKPIA